MFLALGFEDSIRRSLDILLAGITPVRKQKSWHDRMEEADSSWSDNRKLLFESTLNRLPIKGLCSACACREAIISCHECEGVQLCSYCDDSKHESLPYHNRITHVYGHITHLSPLEILDEACEINQTS